MEKKAPPWPGEDTGQNPPNLPPSHLLPPIIFNDISYFANINPIRIHLENQHKTRSNPIKRSVTTDGKIHQNSTLQIPSTRRHPINIYPRNDNILHTTSHRHPWSPTLGPQHTLRRYQFPRTLVQPTHQNTPMFHTPTTPPTPSSIQLRKTSNTMKIAIHHPGNFPHRSLLGNPPHRKNTHPPTRTARMDVKSYHDVDRQDNNKHANKDRQVKMDCDDDRQDYKGNCSPNNLKTHNLIGSRSPNHLDTRDPADYNKPFPTMSTHHTVPRNLTHHLVTTNNHNNINKNTDDINMDNNIITDDNHTDDNHLEDNKINNTKDNNNINNNNTGDTTMDNDNNTDDTTMNNENNTNDTTMDNDNNMDNTTMDNDNNTDNTTMDNDNNTGDTTMDNDNNTDDTTMNNENNTDDTTMDNDNKDHKNTDDNNNTGGTTTDSKNTTDNTIFAITAATGTNKHSSTTKHHSATKQSTSSTNNNTRNDNTKDNQNNRKADKTDTGSNNNGNNSGNNNNNKGNGNSNGNDNNKGTGNEDNNNNEDDEDMDKDNNKEDEEEDDDNDEDDMNYGIFVHSTKGSTTSPFGNQHTNPTPQDTAVTDDYVQLILNHTNSIPSQTTTQHTNQHLMPPPPSKTFAQHAHNLNNTTGWTTVPLKKTAPTPEDIWDDEDLDYLNKSDDATKLRRITEGREDVNRRVIWISCQLAHLTGSTHQHHPQHDHLPREPLILSR